VWAGTNIDLLHDFEVTVDEFQSRMRTTSVNNNHNKVVDKGRDVVVINNNKTTVVNWVGENIQDNISQELISGKRTLYLKEKYYNVGTTMNL